jgi:hypothetical protein
LPHNSGLELNMTTLGGSALTLLDIQQTRDPKGNIAPAIELLSQSTDLMSDIPMQECNDAVSHEFMMETGLPQGMWRQYNVGVAPTKGTQVKGRAQTGILQSKSRIDQLLAERNGMDKVSATRALAAKKHIRGLGQQLEAAFLYEDERTNKDRITGFMPHYSTVQTAVAASAENVIDGGGTGSDNCSILIIGWGMDTIFGIVPAGNPVGLQHKDDNILEVADGTGVAGATFSAYQDTFTFRGGLCVADWRYGMRIPNIDVSNVRAGTGPNLINLLIEGLERIPSRAGIRLGIYVPRFIRTALRMQINTAAAYGLTQENFAGKQVLAFDGVPLNVCDQLLTNESRVT